MRIYFFIFLILYGEILWANDKELDSVRQYVITKSSKINVRTGPDSRYKIKYIYIKKNMPLKIINIFEEWYQLQDIEGDIGWIHKNLITKPKKNFFVFVRSHNDIMCYKEPITSSQVIFYASYLSDFKLKACEKDYCFVKKHDISGWCKKNDLWGV